MANRRYFICDICRQVYYLPQDDRCCPNVLCHIDTTHSLNELDENLAHIIAILNSNNIYTTHCCSGHYYRDVIQPYIKINIIRSNKENIKKLDRAIMQHNKSHPQLSRRDTNKYNKRLIYHYYRNDDNNIYNMNIELEKVPSSVIEADYLYRSGWIDVLKILGWTEE